MPLITSQFLIDLVDLKHSRKPEEVIKSYINAHAREMGTKIVEAIPHTRIPFEQPNLVPEVAFTRDHEFKDLYKLELFVMTRSDHSRLIELLSQHGFFPEPVIEELKSILNK